MTRSNCSHSRNKCLVGPLKPVENGGMMLNPEMNEGIKGWTTLFDVKIEGRTSISKGEDFLNEVASISRTNHVNIVTLLGFCYEPNKRALIYEFMPNDGSLDKFRFGRNNDRNPSLPWETLFNIGLSIARGLDYLHRGGYCNARILHLDVKPHNILLNEEFCPPKISDFGLAKLCPLQESTVSLLELGSEGDHWLCCPRSYFQIS